MDRSMLNLLAGKFDPSQPRDPHTGEWIDTPGLPSVQILDHAGAPTAVGGMRSFDSGVHGPARTSLDEDSTKATEDVLNLIAKTHKWPKDVPIPIRPIDTGQSSRGEFVQQGGRSSEIRIEERLSAEETKHVVAHEMGHFLDASLAAAGNFLSEGVQADGHPSPAMEDFLRLARDSDAMQIVMKIASPEERDYLNSPRELWARAYAQWLTGQAAEGRTVTTGSWDPLDFRPIGKAVADVLREQGLL